MKFQDWFCNDAPTGEGLPHQPPETWLNHFQWQATEFSFAKNRRALVSQVENATIFIFSCSFVDQNQNNLNVLAASGLIHSYMYIIIYIYIYVMFTCFSHWRMIDFCSFPHLAQAVLNLPTFSSHNCCLRTVLDGLQPRMQAHKRECRTWLFGYCDSLMRPLIVTSTANLWTALAFSQDRFTFAAPWRNRGKGGTWTTLQSQCTRCCPGLGRALTTSYEKQLYGRIWPDIAGEKPWQALFEFISYISIYFNNFNRWTEQTGNCPLRSCLPD